MNLLLLAPPLYMLQVFDRVLTSRSGETLLMLTLAVALALVMMAALDVVRAYLLGALGAALDRRLGPKVLDGLLNEAARLAGREHASALRDVHCLRSFFSGSGILALFDAPWLPVFLLVIALFHPLMGLMALAGALTMLTLAFVNERMIRLPLERSQAEGRRAARFTDMSLRNAEVVNALGMLRPVTRRWTALNEAALAEQTRATRFGAALSGLTKFTRQFIQSAMLALGAYIVLDQQVTAGVMIAATILLGRALAPVEQLVAGWRAPLGARAPRRDPFRVFASRPAADPAAAPPPPPRRRGVVDP